MRNAGSRDSRVMFGLEQYADAFDRMHAEVQGDFDKLMLKDAAEGAGRRWGGDSGWTYATGLLIGTAWALGTFVLSAGKGLVDTLRLGEGIKSGTVGGVAEDGMRLLNVLPLLGVISRPVATAARTRSLTSALRTVGQQGARSCGPTAISAAGRISGQQAALTLEEVGHITAEVHPAIHPNHPSFPGMWAREVNTTLKAVNVTSEEISVAGGLNDVEMAVQKGRGPVIIGAQWWEETGGVIRQQPAGNAWSTLTEPDHWLVAFKGAGGRTMVADQFGIRPLAEAGTIQGHSSPFTLVNKALLVEDGALMKTLTMTERFGAGVRGAPARGWLASNFMVNMVVVNQQQTWTMDNVVRQEMGKPLRPWPGMPGSMTAAIAARNLSGASGGGAAVVRTAPCPPCSPGRRAGAGPAAIRSAPMRRRRCRCPICSARRCSRTPR
ncbi:hypothetical protein [Sphingomonas bacterium]|uniref:hypothetical protein n=1 Tax=Sphingomonas bacterium TaxID=1895847 RepID=UPI001576CE6B|nr:hypothetical protein [Sphingomonas bacterium]